MKVSSCMREGVVTCHVDDSLLRVSQLLWDHDIGALPVVDVSGKLVGMVTDRDVAMTSMLRGRPLHELLVSDAMSRQVHVCRPDDSLHSAETILRMNQVRRLPVVDETYRPVGMLTVNDLCRQFSGQNLTAARQMDADQLVQTMAAIGAPRRQEPVRVVPRKDRSLVIA